MKKHMISIVTILLISLLLSTFLYNVQAVGLDTLGDGSGYEPKTSDAALPMAQVIIGVIRALGTSIALLMLTIMGVKYIMGSVEEKAAYKQTMIPYLIGAVLIFSAAQVTQVIYDAITNVS